MANVWPHDQNPQDITSGLTCVQAIRWRREDLGEHELESKPPYDEAIDKVLTGFSSPAQDFWLRKLVLRLEDAFGQGPMGIGLLRTNEGEHLDPKVVTGTWKQLVRELRSLFGDPLTDGNDENPSDNGEDSDDD